MSRDYTDRERVLHRLLGAGYVATHNDEHAIAADCAQLAVEWWVATAPEVDNSTDDPAEVTG